MSGSPLKTWASDWAERHWKTLCGCKRENRKRTKYYSSCNSWSSRQWIGSHKITSHAAVYYHTHWLPRWFFFGQLRYLLWFTLAAIFIYLGLCHAAHNEIYITFTAIVKKIMLLYISSYNRNNQWVFKWVNSSNEQKKWHHYLSNKNRDAEAVSQRLSVSLTASIGGHTQQWSQRSNCFCRLVCEMVTRQF